MHLYKYRLVLYFSLVFPHFLSGGSGEDVRIAMDAYHRELAKLNSTNAGGLPHPLAALHAQNLSSVHNGIAQDLSLPKQVKREKASNEDEKKEEERHGGSAFSLVRPKVEPGKYLFIISIYEIYSLKYFIYM